MNEELKKYYDYLKSVKADVPDTFESFSTTLSDETTARQYFDYLKANQFDTPDTYESFANTFGIKKKVSATASVGEDISIVSPEPSKESLTQPQPSKSERKTSWAGDVLRSLKSGSLRAAGGIVGTPQLLNRTITGLAVRPIVKSMGGTDADANLALDAMLMATPSTSAILGGAETQAKLNKIAQKTEAKMFPIEGSIFQNIKEGDWGQAGEQLMRGVFQSAPYLAMTVATAGGGTPAVLGTIGATAAAQQYSETEGKKESKRLLNAWLYGGFEAAGELVTAGIANSIGRAFKSGVISEIKEPFVKGVTKQIVKDFGLEGSSEAATQIGQNFTDIVTGVDPNRKIFDGVLDAALIGGVSGGGLGVAHIGASLLGRTLASDKEVQQVQDNVQQEAILIDQIEDTDSDPVKKALESRLKTLRYEADKIKDKNYELAKTLSPEQQQKVAELYSTWNELQGKIDSGQLTEQEVTALESAVEGIKSEIESVKEAQIEKLAEIKKKEAKFKIGDDTFETEEAVEAWLDKNYQKRGLPPIWHTPTEKVIDAWYKRNKEEIDKRELQPLFKTEEETKDAKGTGTEITEGSQQPQGVVEGEESGLRLEDTSQDRVEASTGEELSEIVVAPFYNTQVKSPEEADTLRQTPEYQQHIQNIKDKASILGFEITDLSENIGHYTNDAGEKITELSNSITIKGTYEQAQQLAAVLGATTPEVQETTIAGHYVKAGDVTHESDEVNIQVSDFKGALGILDDIGIDYTLNQSNNTIKFLDFSKGEDLDFKNKVITFANKLAEKGIQYGNEERRPTQSKLINAEDRRTILGRLNEEAVQRGQGGAVIRGITEEATQRNEEFLQKRAGVTPVQKPAEFTELEQPPKVEQVVKESGVKAQSVKDLYKVNRDIFGLNRVQALAGAIIGDRMVGEMAKRSGITKQAMYDRLEFSKVKPNEVTGVIYQMDVNGVKTDVRDSVEGLDVVDGFYSNIEKSVRQFGRDGQKAKDWLNTLGKKDEAIFTGVRDWMLAKDPNEMVSKRDILDFMKNNRVKIVEVVKGANQFDAKLETLKTDWFQANEEKTKIADELGDVPYRSFSQWKQDYDWLYRDDNGNIKDVPDKYIDKLNEIEDKRKRLEDYEETFIDITGDVRTPGYTKFSQYQLPGDKTDYKEILVTMPERTDDVFNVGEAKDKQKEMGKYIFLFRDGVRIQANTKEEAIAEYQSGDYGARGKFRSSHWDEPNILVHLRMNTRTDSEGKKVLFLEEVQSDFGERVRKEGFIDEKKLKKERELYNLGREYYYAFRNLDNPFLTIGVEKETITEKKIALYRKLLKDTAAKGYTEEDIRETMSKWGDFTNEPTGKGLPNAPYVGDTNSWVKLGLKYALRHAIDIGADKIAWTTGEQQNERYDLSKQVDAVNYSKSVDEGYYNIGITKDGFTVDSRTLKKEELEGYVGKEIAQKIINGESTKEYSTGLKEISGVDLKVGGKGMIGFYGSPAEGKTGIVGNVVKSLLRELTGKEGIIGEVEIPLRAKGRIEDQLLSDEVRGGETPLKQSSIDITPEIRSAVEKGMALYQKDEGVKRGAVKLLQDGKAIIYAMTDPNVVTPLHELAHVYQDYLKADEKSAVLKWAGTEAWTTDTSEKFARGFEQYLKEGKAPQSTLQKIFDKFKKWLTDIYNSTKEELVLNDAMRSIYSQMLGVEIPVEAKTETTETVSPPSEVTPPLTGKVAEKAPKEAPEREKRLLNRFLNAKKLSDKFKEHLQKYGTTYTTVPNDVTSEEVDYLLASNSSVENEKAVMDTANDLLPRVRGLMGIRLVSMLDYFADTAEQEGDVKSSARYRMRAVKLAEWLDETVREWGRGIQIFASTEVNAALAPKSQVIKAKRAIRKQRDTQIKKNKKDIDTKKESLQEANKESVDEVVKSKEFEDLKQKVLDLEQKIREVGKEKPTKTIPQTKIAKEKAFRTTKWADFKKHGKETLSASIAGLNAKQIEDLGEIVASYVREGVYRTEDLLNRLKKDFFKNTGDVLSDEDARKLLPKEVDGKSLADIEEEGVIESSAEALAVKVEKMFQDPKTPKDDPIKQMIDTLFEKIKEKDTAEKIKPEGKSVLDKIRDSLVRRKLYSDVWEKAKDIVTIKIDSNEDLSEEQKSEYKKRIADFYNEVIGKPFSEGQAEKATRKGIKELGLAIDKIVKDHYTVYDASKRSLQEKLVEELGLGEEESKLLADAVGKAFDKIALEKKRAILQKGITPREITNPKKAKATWEKLIELTNLGAFSDSEFAEAYADAWGFPKLTDEQVKELERLAKKVYEAPEGFQKYERIQDLLAYQARIPGIDAGEVALGLWYASILSGFRTQFKNVFANTLNTIFEFTVATAKHPFNFTRMWRLAEAIGTGWVKGSYAFMHILRSGYNPIRGFKIETPQALEQKQFTGWAKFANAFKYVPRFMVAADAFSYAGLKEMRAFELAMNLAREENKKLEQPRKQDWAKANEILGRTKEKIAESRAQAIQEGFKEGTGDFYRRLWELMEQARGQEIIEDSAHFAAHGTFNYPPEGLIGFATEFIGEFTQWSPIRMRIAGRQVTIKPAKLIIPFTRIIANVANVALDYFPPVGAVRWATGSIGKGLDKMRLTKHVYREYTADERKTVLVKMLMGVLAEAAFFALSEPPDDDSEQYFEITANGTGDYKKNNELREKGWQPYSIRIGDRWYSYQYTPLVLALAPMGFFRDEEKYHKDRIDEKGKMKLLGFSYFKSLSVMGEMTWVTQLTGLLDAISAPSLSEVDSYFQRMAQTTAKGVIYPKIAEQTVQVIDYVQKNPRKESLTLGGKILKDIPIARNKYYNMLNAVGEPVQYDPFQMISATVSDPFWDYLSKNDIFIGKPQKKISFYDGKEEIERSFTDEEYYNFVLASGQEIKRRITEEVMPIDMPKSEVKKAIDEIKSTVRKQTMVEMFGWGDFRKNSPEKWQLLKDNDAIQVPVSSPIDWETEKGKHTATSEEMVTYNQKAINYYYDLMSEYLRGDAETDKSDTNEATGESWYYTAVRTLWSNAKAMAKYDMAESE